MENGSNVTDYYKKTATFWSDMISMMSSKPTTLSTVGPMRNFSSNLKKITSELTEANKETVEFNNFLIEYYKQLADTWTNAQKEVTSKATKIPANEEGTEAFIGASAMLRLKFRNSPMIFGLNLFSDIFSSFLFR